MVEELRTLGDISASDWETFCSHLSSVSMEALSSDLEFLGGLDSSLDNLYQGYLQFKEKQETSENRSSREFLSTIISLNLSDIGYDKCREYNLSLLKALEDLFKEFPLLREESFSSDSRDTIYKQEKTQDDLVSIADSICGVTDKSESYSMLRKYIMTHPQYFDIGYRIVSNKTVYSTLFNKRAYLQEILEGLRFLCRKYENGETPASWRGL